MISLLLISMALALPPVKKPDTGPGLVHKVIENGKTIEQPKDCIEEEIRKRTVIIYVGGERVCSGVIVDKDHIALAGHCSQDVMKAGRRKLYSGSTPAGVDGFVYFDPEKKSYQQGPPLAAASGLFQGNFKDGTVSVDQKDLMVLRLGTSLKGVEPLPRVPTSQLNAFDKFDLIVAGWGLDENGKLSGNVKYLESNGSIDPFGEPIIESLPKNKMDRVRKGDSGGPMFRVNHESCRLELVGITKGYLDQKDGTTFSTGDGSETIDAHIEALNREMERKAKRKSVPRKVAPAGIK